MTAPASTQERLQALEAAAFRTSRNQADVDARLEHVTGALGELSQQSRATALDVRELRTELSEVRDEMREGFTALHTEMREGFAGIAALLRSPSS